jgi:hypothetical protein
VWSISLLHTKIQGIKQTPISSFIFVARLSTTFLFLLLGFSFPFLPFPVRKKQFTHFWGTN